jgi:hypothetical protein
MRLKTIAIIGIVICAASVSWGLVVANGTTSKTIYFKVLNRTNDVNDAQVIANYRYRWVTEGNTPSAAIDMTELAATNSAYSSGGAKSLGYGGLMRFDVPNQPLRAGAHKDVFVTITDANGGDRIDTWSVQLSPVVDANAVDALVEQVKATLGVAGAGLTGIPTPTTTRLKETTVAASPAPTTRTFTLASGPAHAISYPVGTQVIIIDADDPTNPNLAIIQSYTDARLITLFDPLPFTPATGDTVVVVPVSQYRKIGGTAP